VIDHAVRSTQEGGELAIALGLGAGDVVLRVSYPGRGFGPAALPRIFEMCVAQDDDDADTGRLRLGFSLARRLIELHDGSIRASSGGVTQGATFELRMPQPPQDVELTSLELAEPHGLPTVRMAALDHPSTMVDDEVA
jgi:K+-sensing histidine kinase KdpD